MSKRGRPSNEKKNLTLPSLQRVKKYRLLRCLTAQLNEDVIYWVMIFFLALCEASGGYYLMKWPRDELTCDYTRKWPSDRRATGPQKFDLSAVPFGLIRQEFLHASWDYITFSCLNRCYGIVWYADDLYKLQAGAASCVCEVQPTCTLADMVDVARQGFRGIPVVDSF
jgi:hypothetical protein